MVDLLLGLDIWPRFALYSHSFPLMDPCTCGRRITYQIRVIYVSTSSRSSDCHDPRTCNSHGLRCASVQPQFCQAEIIASCRHSRGDRRLTRVGRVGNPAQRGRVTGMPSSQALPFVSRFRCSLNMFREDRRRLVL